jgi:hypothetical protein
MTYKFFIANFFNSKNIFCGVTVSKKNNCVEVQKKKKCVLWSRGTIL